MNDLRIMNDRYRGSDHNSRCGFVAIVGRPNVGKSTLLNHILGQKISITSRKPQTTRHRIIGLKTLANVQAIYVDTPGLHQQQPRQLNKVMNRAVLTALRDVDAIIFIVDGLQWTEEDDAVLQHCQGANVPVLLAINKIDKIKDKQALLPVLKNLAEKMDFAAVFPISAKQGTQVTELEAKVCSYLPESVHYYPDDQVTDRSQRFLAAEFIREKIMRLVGEEIPYSISVEIESFKDSDSLLEIAGLIWVERAGQKKIVIGKDGAVLKEVGRNARLEMERLFGKKVFLQLWVKVKSGWADDARALRSLGYDEE